jgi:hypothetical protein
MNNTKKYILFATSAVSIALALVLTQQVNQMGYKSGYQSAISHIRKAVEASQYPVVDITYPGRQAISITVGDVCKPYPSHLPAFYHEVEVSPRKQPCHHQIGEGPYHDSKALKAITKQVQQ